MTPEQAALRMDLLRAELRRYVGLLAADLAQAEAAASNTQATPLDDYRTVQQVAAERYVTTRTVTQAINRGNLRAQRVGGMWLIHRADAAAWRRDQ